MIDNTQTSGPWLNPNLNPGVYTAVVERLIETTYGDDSDPMIQIELRIPSINERLTTRIYFPSERAGKSQQRLSFFLSCVQREFDDITYSPRSFEEQKLRIVVERYMYSEGWSYSDVKAFLPLTTDDGSVVNEDDETALYPDAWILPLGNKV